MRLAAVIAAIVLSAACVEAQTISGGTGGTGRVYYPLSGGMAALASGLQRWRLRQTTAVERWMLAVAGFLLAYSNVWADPVGLGLVALVIVMQRLRPGSAR